jgi:glycosyltransferase involved in cell wall biosynthesis
MSHASTVRPKICIVCATPIMVHFFLKDHIRNLAQFADITLLTNLETKAYTPPLDLPVRIISIRIERKIDLIRDVKALYHLTKHLRASNYDLVWAVGPKSGLLGMIAAYLGKVKVRVFIFLGEVWASQKGLKKLFLKTLDRLTATLATHLLAASQSERIYLINEKVTPADKIIVLGKGSISGVDTERYKPSAEKRAQIRAQHGIPENAVLALYLGRVNTEKGVIDLAHAFAAASVQCPQLWLLIAGPDEGNLASQIEDIFESTTKNYRITGFVENPEDYFPAADFLCLPSYREGFGMVTIEAAAVSIPTIGSRIYGISDAIIDNETGLLIELGNIKNWTAALVRLSDSNELREQLGHKAMQTVRRDYEGEKIVALYTNYFRSLCRDKYLFTNV